MSAITTATLLDIAAALGISKQSVHERAGKEAWPYQEETVRGGKRRVYALDTLPKPVRESILRHRAHQSLQGGRHAETDGRTGDSSPLGVPEKAALGGDAGAVGAAAGRGSGGAAGGSSSGAAGLPAVVGGRVSGGEQQSAGVAGKRRGVAGLPDAGAGAAGKSVLPATIGRLKPVANLDARQREIEESRAVIIRWVEKSGLKLESALETLNVHASEGRLDASLAHAYSNCHDKKREGQRLAKKTYYNWLGKAKSGALAPGKRTKDLSMPEWAGLLLQHYRLPQKPTLTQAMAAALPVWTGAGFAPFSYDQAYRFLKNLETYAPEILYRGRNQGAAMKALLPFVRRDTEHLWSNDVWTGDGHGIKAKVQHPDHGRPFTPEVTMIMDVASRKALGWSVSFAENVIAVCDALRHAVTRHGLPLIYYSDNGGGQTGKVLDAPIGGMLARLGIQHETGIPGNPQGRGLIERLWGTLTIPLAKQLPTFRGTGADGDYLRRTNIQIEKDLRAGRTPCGLPTLTEFCAGLDAAIAWYNGEHVHSALGSTPDQAYAARLREADRVMLDEHEKLHLFRPHVERTASRGEVSLWHNIYFSRELMDVDKQKVLVGYDLHDPAFVVVRRLDGEFICRADWNANKAKYFPESKTDNLREQRVDRRLKKLDGERELAIAESRQGRGGGTVIEHADPEADAAVLSGFAPIETKAPREPEPEMMTMEEMAAKYLPKKEPVISAMRPDEDVPMYLVRLQRENKGIPPSNEAAAR